MDGALRGMGAVILGLAAVCLLAGCQPGGFMFPPQVKGLSDTLSLMTFTCHALLALVFLNTVLLIVVVLLIRSRKK